MSYHPARMGAMNYLRNTTFWLTALLLPGGFLLLVPKAYRAIRRYQARNI